MASSRAQSMFGTITRLPVGPAARLISDEVMGEKWRARVLCSELEHLARRDAGGHAFLERLPEIRKALGL